MDNYLSPELIAVYISVINIFITIFLTFRVESVKNSYSKSLENHKDDLRKDFESYKYRVKLYNSIDEQLISKIHKALTIYHSEEIADPQSDDLKLISSACDLTHFLSSYSPRYSHIKQFVELNDIASSISLCAELEGSPILRQQIKDEFIDKLNLSISILLPKFT